MILTREEFEVKVGNVDQGFHIVQCIDGNHDSSCFGWYVSSTNNFISRCLTKQQPHLPICHVVYPNSELQYIGVPDVDHNIVMKLLCQLTNAGKISYGGLSNNADRSCETRNYDTFANFQAEISV